MSFREYLPAYRSQTSERLKSILPALDGQDNDKARERGEAIRHILAERQSGEPVKVERPEYQRGFDEMVAEWYLAKISNAKERGIAFDLTLADFRKLCLRKTCFYSGMRLNALGCPGEKRANRTLDRIDNSKGYTKENTVACSYAVNTLKNHIFEDQERSPMILTKREFLKFADWAKGGLE